MDEIGDRWTHFNLLCKQTVATESSRNKSEGPEVSDRDGWVAIVMLYIHVMGGCLAMIVMCEYNGAYCWRKIGLAISLGGGGVFVVSVVGVRWRIGLNLFISHSYLYMYKKRVWRSLSIPRHLTPAQGWSYR